MTARPRSRTLVGLATALLMLVPACGSGGSDGSGGAEGAQPRTGGTMTIALSDAPGCLDPHQLAQGSTLNVGRQLVDSLTVQDTQSGEVKPWLATRWESTNGGATYTFTLRDGATFSDGKPVDAAAVKANFEDIQKLGARSLLGSTYLQGLQSIETPDAQTVRVTFAQPNAQFLQATSSITLGLLSPATLALSAQDRCAGQLIGSGPYTLGEVKLKEAITLNKRAGYNWPSSLATHQGEARLDKVVFQIITETAVRTGSLRSGQVQGIQDVQPVDQRQFESGNFWLLHKANPGIVTGWVPNEQRETMADKNVRLALQAAVNRQEIVDTLYNQRYPVAKSVLAAGTPGFVDLGGDLAHNPDRAKQLLDDAGWVPGGDGVRTKDGKRLTLVLLGAGREATLVQQQVRAVGIELQIRQVDAAQYVEIQKSGDYDLAGYNLTRADPEVLRAVFSTEFTNVPRLKPNPLDQTLRELSTTPDTTARERLAGDAQRTIIGEVHFVPLVEQAQVFAFSSKAKNVTLDAWIRLNLYDAYLEA